MLSLQAFKLIFTSPTSAQEVSASDNAQCGGQGTNHQSPSDKATRSNVASLIGMRTVKPRAIAYVAVQVCHPRLALLITDGNSFASPCHA
jgi:hypothetical protein